MLREYKRVNSASCGTAEVLAIDVVSCKSKFRLMLVYNPPSVSSGIVTQFENLFTPKMLKIPTIILGDFNIDWASESNLKDSFDTLMSLNQFDQLISEFTREFKSSKTIIDLLFTNVPELVCKHEVMKCDISDHYAIACVLNVKRPRSQFSYITRRNFRSFVADEFFEHAKFVDFHTIANVKKYQ